MSKSSSQAQTPDQQERIRALNPVNSVLVQAPAGSGKTDLLTRRFLALLAQVQDPAQIVAITFTKAAAAEMRHRILEKLQNAADEIASSSVPAPDTDAYSMESLARRALLHSQVLNWNLLDQPAQLRISTIDSFCREIALQQPLLSGLGDGIGIYEQPEDLYRRAARQTLQQIDGNDPALAAAIERLLLWRDNNWQELETQLVEMLRNRDRWMQGFVLDREQDWGHLRQSLEQSFHRAIAKSLSALGQLFDQVPGSRGQAQALARFACQNGSSALQPLAELADFPDYPDIADPASHDLGALEEAHQAYLCLAELLLTLSGTFRKQVTKANGFPSDRKQEKGQILDLIARLPASNQLFRPSALSRRPATPRTTGKLFAPASPCFAAPQPNFTSCLRKPAQSTTPRSRRPHSASSSPQMDCPRTPLSLLATASTTCSLTNFKTPAAASTRCCVPLLLPGPSPKAAAVSS